MAAAENGPAPGCKGEIMSGIVGYVGKKDSLQLLFEGLTRLEYRGYDSSGIAYRNGSGIEVYRTPGRLTDLQKLLPQPLPAITIGIGHMRWATHGEPTAANAHPHTVRVVSVVHNGIIDDRCRNSGCSHSCYCRASVSCAVITRDERKRIANSVVRLLPIADWEQMSASSLLEASGLQLQKTVHQEQASKGLRTCFLSPY